MMKVKTTKKLLLGTGVGLCLAVVWLYPAASQVGMLPPVAFQPPVPPPVPPSDSVPNGSLAPSGQFRVFAVDEPIKDQVVKILEEPIPSKLVQDLDAAWLAHQKHLGMTPGVDTTYLGKPVVFVRKRAKVDQNSGIAAVSTGYPAQFSNGAAAICSIPGARNWCQDGAQSLRFNLDHADTFFAVGLASHEMVHLFQGRTTTPKDTEQPHWLYEGESNGIGFGLMESIDRDFTRRAIGRRYATNPPGDSYASTKLAFYLGLRHYDQPLAIDHIQTSDWRHPDYPAEGGSGKAVNIDTSSPRAFIDSIYKPDANWHLAMTGYMTGSLFRHALKGRPAGAKAIRELHSGRVAFPTDARDMRDQLRWLDDGLKLATVEGLDGAEAPVWRRGLRDVFPEMIVELADLPDLVIGRRHGRLSQQEWDQRLWSTPCIPIDLSTSVAMTYRITIQPIAARCFRVKMPPESIRQNWLDLKPSIYSTKSIPAVPEPFVVTVEDKNDASTCRDLDLGTRGQMLSYAGEPKLPDKGCSVSWTAYYAPLKQGGAQTMVPDQTVILTNVADEAEKTKERTVFVHIVRPSVSANVSGSATPTGNGDPKPKKPLPKPKRSSQPSVAPPHGITPVEPPEPSPDCDPEARAVFECGDGFGLTLLLGDSAEMTRAMFETANAQSMLYLPAAITRDTGPDGNDEFPDTLQHILTGLGDPVVQTALQAISGKVLGQGLQLTFSMQRLASGQTGTFPARVDVEWVDENGEGGEVSSVNAATTEMANNCVVVKRRKSNAQVTIAQNGAGFLLGSLSATLFEPEPDAEKACRQPYSFVGTIQASFSNPGLVHMDVQTLDYSRVETRLQIDQDLTAQIVTVPLDERSDLDADDLVKLRERSNNGSGASNGMGAGAAQCPVTLLQSDYRDFAAAVFLAEQEEPNPEGREAAISQLTAMAKGILRPQVCAWVLDGRPARWTLKE